MCAELMYRQLFELQLLRLLECHLRFAQSESECEVRMPKKEPCLGRDPVQKMDNYEQFVKRTRQLCTTFHELSRLFHPPVSICSHIPSIIPTRYSTEFLEFACPRNLIAVLASGVSCIQLAYFHVFDFQLPYLWYGIFRSATVRTQFFRMFSVFSSQILRSQPLWSQLFLL